MGASAQRVWSFSAGERRRAEHRHAVTVAVLFVVFGAAWVLLTDALLYAVTRDRVLIARIETAKGWVFVSLGGALFYAVALRSAARLGRAHATFFAVVESIADGVLLLGEDRTVRYANSAALRMLRCERPRDLVGIDAAEFSRRYRLSYPDGSLIPPDDFVSQRVFVEGGPLCRKSVLHPPGAPALVVSTTAAAVREEVGDPPGVVVSVMHDITAEEHLERLRDRFFADAAHALKTPITIIKANAQLLSRDVEERLRRSTAAIERQCGRIDRLVQNLLVIARGRSRTLQLRVEEVELGPLAERVAREMGSGASLQHELRVEVPASPRVHADPQRLAMVVRNLVDEASRASAPGASITVRIGRRGADAEISVRHRPLSVEEGRSALPDGDRSCELPEEPDEREIARCASNLIARAHGAALGEEGDGAERAAWIRLPRATPRGAVAERSR
jgi:signal transduction histidine kinase